MIDVTTEGLDGLRADFARLPRVVRTNVSPAIGETAQAIVAGAQARVRVRTGRLRAAIAARVVRDDAGGIRTRVEITDPIAAAYAPHQEFGTRFSPANPFIGPAADAQRARYMDRLEVAGHGVESEMK